MFSFASIIAVASVALFSLVPASAVPTGNSTLLARQSYSGDGTYYSPGLGACGLTNADTDLIVAVSTSLYDSYPGATSNPNLNPICGKTITATYNGKSVTAAVEDKCYACAEYDLDFSPSAFQQLADESVGRIEITWQFN
ncbi:barwin-like endoglucanase [Stereum hirsutum FP-91666 SS1]|uniref:barwin-like endoglucanase n=1 Tax=Stereum hirsutum (strain FP-91666) TaxID=721885 RepID=UPI0004449945|nr:barwin-like endoglucanase [Stereum hirsutum FP-91666 SS1]EIM82454.1 barwin-like endoglucanase [Stereum hirsutum FP-91666 SS1]